MTKHEFIEQAVLKTLPVISNNLSQYSITYWPEYINSIVDTTLKIVHETASKMEFDDDDKTKVI